jgi:uncharacterized protein
MIGWAMMLAAAGQAAGGATTLDVSAEGHTTRVPDLATVRAGVVTAAPTAAAALADNARATGRVLARLRAAGVAERDIQTARVALEPQYREVEGRAPAISGYQAVNTLAVRFRDVGRAGPVLDALVAEGANQVSGPDFSLADPDAALDEARTDAVRRARARADLYARAAGLRVGRIVSIEEGGENDGGRPPVVFARMAAADRTQVAAGETEVTATVKVRFELE